MPQDWIGFFGEVIGAAIGATAAFLFALWLSRMERDRSLQKEREERRKVDRLSTVAGVDACASAMEELVNFKHQIAIDLIAEAAKLEAALKPGTSVAAIFAEAIKLPTLFKEIPSLSLPDFPTSDRFSFAIEDVPAITSFVHRAASTCRKVNEHAWHRNDVLRRYADVARSNQPAASDLSYFYPMLISQARALAEAVDDALFFGRLLHDQCYYLGVEKFTRPKFRRVVFPPDKLALLPAHDYVPGYAGQLKTFGHPEVERLLSAQQ